MANSNLFLSPYKILLIAQEIFGEIFFFYQEIVCCMYSTELPYQSNSNEYTQHTTRLCFSTKTYM